MRTVYCKNSPLSSQVTCAVHGESVKKEEQRNINMLSRATHRLGRISIRRWKSSYAAAEEVLEQGGKKEERIIPYDPHNLGSQFSR